jgi:hypothetical protein
MNVLRRLVTVGVFCVVAPRPALADWTLTMYLGGARTNDTPLVITQPSDATAIRLSPVHFDSASFESPIYYGYRAAFFPRSGWFGIEGELIHLKVIADTTRLVDADGTLQGEMVAGQRPLQSVIERFSITHGVNLVLVNAVVRRQGHVVRDRPRWIVSGRFGVGASIPHAESAVRGVSAEGYEWGAFSVQGAASVEAHLAGRFYGLAEYKLTRTSQDVAIARGAAQTTLVTQHAAFGVAAHLGRGPVPKVADPSQMDR